ncbi:MAG TPA: hypothetical protein DEP28_10055 [Bacteroidetes bacterium]|nr:hypothetical protein [Bacteroidota bacterium]
MKIIHLEDISEVTFILEEELPSLGFAYIKATSIFEINEILDSDSCECLIIDLNLPTDGLSKELSELTRDGKITGWIWIKHIGINKYSLNPANMIIYSDYIQELDSITDNDLEKIKKIKKRKAGNRESSIKELHKNLEQIKKSLS